MSTGTYVITGQAWYGHAALDRKTQVEEIIVNLDPRGDGPEFIFEWHVASEHDKWLSVRVTDEAFAAFEHTQLWLDLVQARKMLREIQPSDIAALLRDHGFEDVTPHESPHVTVEDERFARFIAALTVAHPDWDGEIIVEAARVLAQHEDRFQSAPIV